MIYLVPKNDLTKEIPTELIQIPFLHTCITPTNLLRGKVYSEVVRQFKVGVNHDFTIAPIHPRSLYLGVITIPVGPVQHSSERKDLIYIIRFIIYNFHNTQTHTFGSTNRRTRGTLWGLNCLYIVGYVTDLHSGVIFR